jgi:hypothetical protein
MQELIRPQEICQQLPAYEVNHRQEVMFAEPDHLTLAYFIVCECNETRKLTVVLQKIGSLTGMWLFSLCFYYGLARLTTRLVTWAASL